MAELVTNLPLLADKIDDTVEHSLDFIATLILMWVKALAPVDTGSLRRSYEIDKIEPTLVLIGSLITKGNHANDRKVDYAIHQEFGAPRANVSAQPHLRPGFERGQAMVEERLINDLRAMFG